MDSKTQARLRLHLRAEKALGLSALPLKIEAIPREGHVGDTPAPARVSSAKSLTPRNAAPAAARSTNAGEVGWTRPPSPAVGKPTLQSMPIAEPFTSPVLLADQKRIRLAQIDADEVKGCTRCRLHSTRTHTVFGEGSESAEIFFIGEGPGENEDLTGRPFVGRAGDLLNKMIAGMGISREQVFIANIVKCRPPNNRAPVPDEVATCTPFLERQLEIIRPKVIVTLGLPAAQYMLQSKLSMGKLRSVWHTWRGIKLMPTYHPAYVLRNYTEETRKAVWDDLKKVMNEVGLKAVSKK